MTPVTNRTIRQYFDDIYASAMDVAEKQAALFMEDLHLNEMELDDQVLKLHNEIWHVEQEIEGFGGKEYSHLLASESVIYKLFSSRLLFQDVNEEEKLKQGLIFRERNFLLIEVYQEKLAQL